MILNLDEDEEAEVIALIARDATYPMLVVFKRIEGTWYLLFHQSFYSFYNEPELLVANVPSRSKTFYIRWLHDRGSGVYLETYNLYKLIDKKVYPSLELISEAHINGWGLPMNQNIESRFKFNSVSADELWVTYKYNFYPGPVMEGDMSWDSHPEISFVSGETGVKYVWDSSVHTYRPDFNRNPGDLTDSKIGCFGDFGNDSLFVAAFKYEIGQTLKTGTEIQKKQLSNYLKAMKENSTK